MAAIIAFFTKIAPFLLGVLSYFQSRQQANEREQEREIGKELEQGKVNAANANNEKNARRVEAEIHKAGDDAHNTSLNDSLRNGKF